MSAFFVASIVLSALGSVIAVREKNTSAAVWAATCFVGALNGWLVS